MQNLLILEFTHYLNESYQSLMDRVTLTDGYLVPTAKPGIGVSLNDDAVNERTETGFRPL
jgi:L-alanine-DL-glutamate epimerase-like enolase superfamily enzyme